MTRLDPTRDQPDHLKICPETGSRRCQVCRRQVSIGADGTEYGHQRRYRTPSSSVEGRCPHRPDGVDPKRSVIAPDPDDLVMDESGQFAGRVATDGGEQR